MCGSREVESLVAGRHGCKQESGGGRAIASSIVCSGQREKAKWKWAAHSAALSVARLYLLNLPKQGYQLGTKCLNLWRTFSFNPQYPWMRRWMYDVSDKPRILRVRSSARDSPEASLYNVIDPIRALLRNSTIRLPSEWLFSLTFYKAVLITGVYLIYHHPI